MTFLRAGKAAEYLGLPRNLFGQYVREGFIPFVVFPGGTIRHFRPSDLDVFSATKLATTERVEVVQSGAGAPPKNGGNKAKKRYETGWYQRLRGISAKV